MNLAQPIHTNPLFKAIKITLPLFLATLMVFFWVWSARGAGAESTAANIYYVDGSGGNDSPGCGSMLNPCQTISYTLGNQGSGGDVIRVAEGVYVENLTLHYTVTLQGGYETSAWSRDVSQYETTIDGSGSGISQSVITLFDDLGEFVLDGLTIRGGSDDLAGGVYGGNNILTIRDSTIRNNYANGGPMSQGAGGVLGGIGGGSVTLIDSLIVSNTVGEGAGGVRVHQGRLAITNTVIADNHGDAGIHVNGPLSMMHVSVANNHGGVLFNPPYTTTLHMANSIVYGNGWAISSPGSGTEQVTYSDVEGGWSGTGNIDAPAEFVNEAAGDYHLLGSSPAIDAGTPAGSPPVDLEGTTRDVHPDMGAYEYQRFDNDLAVLDVLPVGKVAIGVPISVRATLFNNGNLAQGSVPITCEVKLNGSNAYLHVVTSSDIQPLAWQVLEFPAFTPSEEGTHLLTCQSGLPGDENTGNDGYSGALNVQEGIADVWAKDNPMDNGDVPSDLDSWYESPDLWIRNQDDGGLIHQDPIAGVTNTVYVRLRNRGTVAITGTVDVYWIEPSLGVRCGDWAYIDTVPFSNLLPGELRIVKASWVPSRTGHTCLQDVIDSSEDPYNRALECSPLWVPWDNNVEWHNVNILPNPSGGLEAAVDIQQAQVNLANVYNLPKDVDLIVERESFPADGAISLKLPSDLFDRWLASAGHWGEGIQVLTPTKEISITGAISATIGAIPMEAAETAEVELTFDGPPGLEFEITLRERIDGVTVGGVTYQWAIPDTTPPSVLSVSPADEAAQVSQETPVVISFDEPVSPLTFELSPDPDPGGWFYYWSEDSSVVTATHSAFDGDTNYSLAVSAGDGATNSMTAPYQWSFVTQPDVHLLYLPMIR